MNIKAEATKEAADEVVSDMNVTSYGTDVLSTGAVSYTHLDVYKRQVLASDIEENYQQIIRDIQGIE